jgi:hypothetical protein
MPHKAILLDQSHPLFNQAVMDLAVNHMEQTTPFERPNMKKSRDNSELMVRTREIDQAWLEAKAWYPAAVLTGPIDYGTFTMIDGQSRNLGLEWCNDVWMASALMEFPSTAERRAYWQERLP